MRKCLYVLTEETDRHMQMTLHRIIIKSIKCLIVKDMLCDCHVPLPDTELPSAQVRALQLSKLRQAQVCKALAVAAIALSRAINSCRGLNTWCQCVQPRALIGPALDTVVARQLRCAYREASPWPANRQDALQRSLRQYVRVSNHRSDCSKFVIEAFSLLFRAHPLHAVEPFLKNIVWSGLKIMLFPQSQFVTSRSVGFSIIAAKSRNFSLETHFH